MQHIYFDRKCSLLIQEAHLTKNTLLSGFDSLLKANLFQGNDGFFYSSFFNLSIGMERLMKLAVVTHYMLKNNYQAPTIKQLKKDFGHDIETLYAECLSLLPVYLGSNKSNPIRTSNDESLIKFLTEYGIGSRYFNLNEVCEARQDRDPLYKWLDIANAIYRTYISQQVRESSKMRLIYKMDREGTRNDFTGNLNEQGHPMTVFDMLHCQYVIRKSSPLIIWRLIEILRPIHFLLTAMACKATEYEVNNNIKYMVIPHYEDFFYFLLAQRSDIRKTKRWL